MGENSLSCKEGIDYVLQKYADTIYRLALSRTKNAFDAEDIVQEVFLQYIKSNKEFESEDHIKAWLLKVTINCSKNLMGSAWFRKTTVLDKDILTNIEDKSEVYKYVMELPEKYRVVIHLFYYEDMQTDKIGEILNRKQSTVRSQLHRGRKLLKDHMKGEGNFEF